MVFTPNIHSGSGWPFMVAGVCLASAIWVAPFAFARFLERRPKYSSFRLMLTDDSETRMMLGFVMISLSITIFATVGWLKGLMVEDHALETVSEFTRWSRWWIMAPNSVMLCFGNALILWDGVAKRGARACIALLSLAVALWFIGNSVGEYLKSVFW